MSNDQGQLWSISKTEYHRKICYKIEVMDGSYAGRMLVVDISTQDSEARALVLDTPDHDEVDECWMIEEVIMEKGFPVGYKIMKSQGRHKNKYLFAGVDRDEESFWVSVTDRTDADILWFIDLVDKGMILNRDSMKASQSSSLPNGAAPSRAIDGNKNGQKGSCSHTASIRDSWWKVDLGDTYTIEKVVIYNPTDCCQERIDGATVTAVLQKIQVECGKIHYKYGTNEYTIECNHQPSANQIRIDQPNNYLILCEVEIYGTRMEKKLYMPPLEGLEVLKNMEDDRRNTNENNNINNDHSKGSSAGSMFLGNNIVLLVATGIII